jgi:hypothetical protein
MPVLAEYFHASVGVIFTFLMIGLAPAASRRRPQVFVQTLTTTWPWLVTTDDTFDR